MCDSCTEEVSCTEVYPENRCISFIFYMYTRSHVNKDWRWDDRMWMSRVVVATRSIYQQRAGRAGGCSTALRCPGAVASVHSSLRRDPRHSRCRDSALGSVTTTWLLPFYISWNRRLNGRWKVKLPWPTVHEILYLNKCGKWWSYQEFIGLETSAIPVSVIY